MTLTPELIASLYPRLYSEKRLDEWQALFDPRALVVRTEGGAPTVCQTIHEAMPEQREYAAQNETFMEEWQNVQIRRSGARPLLSRLGRQKQRTRARAG